MAHQKRKDGLDHHAPLWYAIVSLTDQVRGPADGAGPEKPSRARSGVARMPLLLLCSAFIYDCRRLLAAPAAVHAALCPTPVAPALL